MEVAYVAGGRSSAPLARQTNRQYMQARTDTKDDSETKLCKNWLGNPPKENKLILSWYNSEGKGIAKTSEARIKTFMDLYHKAELESIFMLPFQKENLNQ